MIKKGLQKYGYVLILLLALTPLLTVCGRSGVPIEKPTVESEPTSTAEFVEREANYYTLRILHPEAPTMLNPHLSLAGKDAEASRITYEPLASVDKNNNLIPFLAVEIPSQENGGVAADGKSVTWKLRQDVKWSDGEPFTADDVLFTYQFISNPQVEARTDNFYDIVESVQVIDPYTVKINFKDKTPGWDLVFVGTYGAIIPRHIFEPYNGPNAGQSPANKLPVGTGPYRVVPPGIKPQEVLFLGTKLVETNKIVFEPNPYFREPDKPFFRRVELRGGGTAREAARLVLQDGKVDYAYNLGSLSPVELEQLKEAGQGRLVINFGPRIERIQLNRTDPNRQTADGERSSLEFPHPFFSDKKVRQAFAHAIDKEAIAKLYTGHPATNNLVAPPQYNSPNTFYEFDPDKARALLDEAGWVDNNGDGIRDKDGVKMKVVYQTQTSSAGEILQQSQQIVKEGLKSIGVEVELKTVDPSVMFSPGLTSPDSIYRFNADMQEFPMWSISPDPTSYMKKWTSSQIPQKANNWVGSNMERWDNPEYDALLEQSTTELNPEKRQQLFVQMNDMLIEDVVMIPIVHVAIVEGASQTLEGVDLTPWDPSTWNIKDWRRISP